MPRASHVTLHASRSASLPEHPLETCNMDVFSDGAERRSPLPPPDQCGGTWNDEDGDWDTGAEDWDGTPVNEGGR